jgi:predicted neutral ceramidase superfamily lipid hydrolase
MNGEFGKDKDNQNGDENGDKKGNQNDIEKTLNKNLFLANLIRIFHIIVILFVFLAPFSNIPALLILHITFAFSLLVHWYYNNNACSLTLFEAKLRGIDVDKSFTHECISPMYDISQTNWSTICYFVTIILMSISIYYLYNSEKVANVFKCFAKRHENPEWNGFSFIQKSYFFFNCFKELLIIRA